MKTRSHPAFRGLWLAVAPASLLAVAMSAAMSVATPAAAMSRASFSVELLVDARPLAEYHARGRHYVEAIEDREYAIRLKNHTGDRVAVALSVDGLNTIDAKKTTASAASKWILAPYQTLTIDGWQTASDRARRFFFTRESESYGAWLGETRDLGIISAAVFRERVVATPTEIQRSPARTEKRRSQAAPSKAGEASAGRDRPAPDAAAELSDDHAATGIGQEIEHRVRRVRFEAENRPAAVLELRYEYHDALVRLGLLPRYAHREDPLDRRERARGFEDLQFSPDPYRRR